MTEEAFYGEELKHLKQAERQLLAAIAEYPADSGGPGKGVTAEIQMRTIALDFWASLEHQLKYKHEVAHEALVKEELKRCADEIASVDLSMQTIRDCLKNNFQESESVV